MARPLLGSVVKSQIAAHSAGGLTFAVVIDSFHWGGLRRKKTALHLPRGIELRRRGRIRHA
ncbi:MAG: hypothetical protein ABSB67_02315 [Bryobacteraceae bacterium]